MKKSLLLTIMLISIVSFIFIVSCNKDKSEKENNNSEKETTTETETTNKTTEEKNDNKEPYVGSYIIDFDEMKGSISSLEEKGDSTKMMKKMVELFEGMSIEIGESIYAMKFMDEETTGKIKKLEDNKIELIPNLEGQNRFTAEYKQDKLILSEPTLGIELQLKKKKAE